MCVAMLCVFYFFMFVCESMKKGEGERERAQE